LGGTVELTDGGSPAPRRDGPDPLVGRRLLHYRVMESIGQGGMSVVYRGRDENLDRDVAIKVLHPFLAEKAECRHRLAREARAVARLEHPNILKVFDFSGDPATINDRIAAREEDADQADNDGFLVCELVLGDTLKHYADRHALWDVPELGCMAVLRIARALQHAHENGVIHRDLKPENVMVRRDGVLKLMDFGIASVVDQKQLTVTGTLLGSPAHMAPESIEGYPADHRSDIFSLGTVLYWLVTGSLPFEALTPHALLKKIVDAHPPPPQQRSPRVSDDISKLIDRAMARQPEDRFESAGDMADALEALLESAGLSIAEEEIAAALADPAEGLVQTSRRVRAAFLHRAETLLDEGAAARSLATLSRVLAEHPGDPDAESLLERAQETALDEEPEPDEVSADDGGEEVVASPPARLAPGRAVVAVTLLGVVAALVGVGALVDGATERSDDDAVAAGDPVAEPKDDPSPPRDEMSLVPPGAAEPGQARPAPEPSADDKPRAGEPPRQPLRVAPRAVIARRPAPDLGKKPPPKPLDPGLARQVTVIVDPYAHIFVDGQSVKENAKRAELQLLPGKHTLRFEHAYAKKKMVDIVVPKEGKVPEVRIVLDEAKPAYLRVKAIPPEAEVVVDGTVKGPARRSMRTPIVVPFEKMMARSRFEVIVHSPGYKTTVVTPEFEAGQTTVLPVVLEPEPDGADDGTRRRPIEPETP
jgi:serine/threonine-protein kinase